MSPSRRTDWLAIVAVVLLMLAVVGSTIRGDGSAAREFGALMLLVIIMHEVTSDE